MSDKPRPWPYVAQDARDRAAMEANAAIRQLGPLVLGETTTPGAGVSHVPAQHRENCSIRDTGKGVEMAYCDYRQKDTDHEWYTSGDGDHVTRDMIRVAYGALASARQEAFDMAQAVIDRKEELEFERSRALLAGEIQGKNEAERDARARELLAKEIGALRKAGRAADIAKYQLDQATAEVERVRLLVRLDEMEAFAGKALPPSREG